jgi:hypothetical protein
MALQEGDLLAALRIPDARSAVPRRSHHPRAIAAERCGIHAVGMAFQDGDLLAALRIPDARGVVVRLPRPSDAKDRARIHAVTAPLEIAMEKAG